ncbi:MAG: hypothetical protein IJX74_02320 [Clostridia bacterium]|nr:hypothetical protein [Clostridia bacterium]
MQYLAKLKYHYSNEHILSALKRFTRYTEKITILIHEDIICLKYGDGVIEHDFINNICNWLPQIEGVEVSEYPEAFSEIARPPSLILDVSKNKSLTAFAKGLLHMQLPFYTDLIKPWLYCHFINIYYCPRGYMNYVDDVNYGEILDIQDVGFDRYYELNRKECFIRAICEGRYIQVWVDNYYISTSPFYEKYHDIHPVLVYGYDPTTYYCARFDKRKGLDFTEIGIEQLHFSIESAKIYYYCPSEVPLKFLKVKEFVAEYNNSAGYFLCELKQYRLGKGSRDFSYGIHKQPVHHTEGFFGLQITQCFIDGLKQPHLYLVFDYRLFHLIVENKQFIVNAMKYHNASNYFKKEIDALIVRFEKIVTCYHSMRLRYIKQSGIENGFDGFSKPPKDEKTVKHIVAVIEQLLHEEKEILDAYIPLMEKKMVADRARLNIKPALRTWNNLQMKVDNEKPYIELDFDAETLVGDLEIYSPSGCFEGDLYCDNELIVCRDMDAEYGFLKISVGSKRLSKIKYYPKTMVLHDGKPEIQITVYKPNYILESKVTASSSFSEIPSISFSPWNVLSPATDETNWAPEQGDNNRWLCFEFASPVIASAFSMCQYKLEPRVLEYKVEAKNRTGVWKTIINYSGVMGITPNYHEFDSLEITALKIIFLREKMDANGYDVPRITNVSLY